jgi:hypothetical protein
LRRLPKRGEERPSADAILDPAGTEWVVLVRATDGKKKISTSVANKAGDKFNKSMTTIQKAYMVGLVTTPVDDRQYGPRNQSDTPREGVTLVDPRRAYGGKHRMTTPRMVRITNRATPGSSEWQPYVMDGLRETAKKPKKERAAGSKKKA